MLLPLLILFRLLNAACVRTFFQPDEYFQALEPAWRIAFGPQSGAWLTWEWQHHLRSSLHPALFAGVYVAAHAATRILRVSPAVAAAMLEAAPTAVQAVFAALGDFYTWKLAQQIYGSSGPVSSAALWMTVLSPWQWYCSTRTFSNSIETTLTIMALYHWPWSIVGDAGESGKEQGKELSAAQNLRLSLLLAAVAVVLRPTNLLVWLAVLTMTVTRLTLDGASPLTAAVFSALAANIVLCGLLVLGISAACDRLYFGGWAFPPYKWLHFNISQSLAIFYGRNAWHYYLSQGIPLLSVSFLPFVAAGLRGSGLAPMAGTRSNTTSNAAKTLAFAVYATVGALSTISHKEVRFIYPLLPMLHVLAAPHFAAFFFPAPSPKASRKPAGSQAPPTIRKALLTLAITLNVVIAGYLSVLHQPAPLSALRFLRREYERAHPEHLALSREEVDPLGASALAPSTRLPGSLEPDTFALFLTPCHSTPWRSHLVYAGLRARALTCEPPLHTAPGSEERASYLDEADRFFADPAAFLAREMWPSPPPDVSPAAAGRVPRFIVGFEGIEHVLLRFFAERFSEGKSNGVKLRRVWEGWNGFFNEDPRRRGLLVVWDTELGDAEAPETRL